MSAPVSVCVCVSSCGNVCSRSAVKGEGLSLSLSVCVSVCESDRAMLGAEGEKALSRIVSACVSVGFERVSCGVCVGCVKGNGCV